MSAHNFSLVRENNFAQVESFVPDFLLTEPMDPKKGGKSRKRSKKQADENLKPATDKSIEATIKSVIIGSTPTMPLQNEPLNLSGGQGHYLTPGKQHPGSMNKEQHIDLAESAEYGFSDTSYQSPPIVTVFSDSETETTIFEPKGGQGPSSHECQGHSHLSPQEGQSQNKVPKKTPKKRTPASKRKKKYEDDEDEYKPTRKGKKSVADEDKGFQNIPDTVLTDQINNAMQTCSQDQQLDLKMTNAIKLENVDGTGDTIETKMPPKTPVKRKRAPKKKKQRPEAHNTDFSISTEPKSEETTLKDVTHDEESSLRNSRPRINLQNCMRDFFMGDHPKINVREFFKWLQAKIEMIDPQRAWSAELLYQFLEQRETYTLLSTSLKRISTNTYLMQRHTQHELFQMACHDLNIELIKHFEEIKKKWHHSLHILACEI